MVGDWALVADAPEDIGLTAVVDAEAGAALGEVDTWRLPDEPTL